MSSLSKGLLWNYVSIGILALSGFGINIIVAFTYGSAGLGVFGQAYGVFVVAAKISSFGIYESCQKHVAELTGKASHLPTIVGGALSLSALVGVLVALLIYLGSDLIGLAFSSAAVASAIKLASPGLAVFAINRVLQGVLNGQRRMGTFAATQSARFLLILISVFAISQAGYPAYATAFAFTAAEVVLFLGLLPLLFLGSHGHPPQLSRAWFTRHFRFGIRSFVGATLMELYPRVDLLLVGVFLPDTNVGIYAFAAMIAEGLYQLLIVVRVNLNPILARLLVENRLDDTQQIFARTRLLVYPSAAVLGAAALTMYPILVALVGDQTLIAGWPILAILIAGIVLIAGYVPFDQILLQGGKPTYHTSMVSIGFSLNVVLNLLLIPLFGLYGAAVSTSLAWVIGAFILVFWAHSKLKVRLR